MSIEIRGIERFDTLARSLDDLSRNLQRELVDAAVRGASGLEASAKASALRVLPKRGGLARDVANSFSVSGTRSAWRYRLRIKDGRNIQAMNRGIVRHMVWGHRDRWVTQRIRKGLVDRPVAEVRPAVEDEVQATLHRLGRSLGR